MKRIIMIAAAAIVAFAACEKTPEDSGVPEVKAPVVTKIQPSSGYVGDQATITGENFSATAADNKVMVGSAEAVVREATATTLKIVLPQNPEGKAAVKVTVNGKTSEKEVFYTYLKVNQPMSVSGIAPTQAKIGDEVVVSGENFGTDPSAVTVLFGDAPAQIKSIAETSITVIVPEGTGEVAVLVLKGDETSDPQMFTYKFDRVVTVKEVSPTMITTGDEVTVVGTGFTDSIDDVTVLFGEIEANVTVSGEDGIKFDVPDGLENLKDYSVTINVAGAAPVTAGPVRFYQVAKYKVECVLGSYKSGTSTNIEGVGLEANIAMPECMVLNPAGTEIWVTSRGGSGDYHGVERVSLSNYEMHIVADKSKIGTGKYPWGGAFNSKGEFHVCLKATGAFGKIVDGQWTEYSILKEDGTTKAAAVPMNCVFDSADNMYIANRDAKEVVVAYDGKYVKSYEGAPTGVYTVAFNPAKTVLAIGCNGGYKFSLLDIETGEYTVVAGAGTKPTATNYTDGDAGNPLTATIGAMCGIYWDNDGCIYFNDQTGLTFRVLIPGVGGDYSKGVVKTLAGQPFTAGCVDGDGLTEVKFRAQGMLTKDPATGAFYVADGSSHRIRKVTVSAE